MVAKGIVFIVALAVSVTGFVHPGLLHTSRDLERVKTHVLKGDEPWKTDWQLLLNNSRASPTYQPNPQPTIYRGSDGTHAENYPRLYNDAHAAYQLAIRWHIQGDDQYADAAVAILNAWSSTMVAIGGSSDRFLAAGIYGYQLANAAELMRSYSGWSASEQDQMKTFLQDVFFSESYRFLTTHNGQDEYHYVSSLSMFINGFIWYIELTTDIQYANWDFCNIANIMAIGVFTDNQTMYEYGKNYFLNGDGRGAVNNFIYKNYTESGSGKILSQGQEAGRDQGHATLDISLLGVIMQQGYNQGDDLFATLGDAGLHASEYVSKYNVGYDVPYTLYESYEGNQTVISADSRYTHRPGFELVYAHYNDIKHANASWTKLYRDQTNGNSTAGVEGGGGNYGPNSGGFDVLGYGTLLYRLSA
ncbi:chondroitin AC/alginate lyase [Fusarium oxysporum]|nr:chondroitin AC/alginate lyase [Fusarium oxysporum]